MDIGSNLKETLERIDKAIAGYKLEVAKGEALKRLNDNPDFQLVIANGYINTEAEELFQILLDPSGASPYSDEVIRRKIDGIVTIKGYLDKVRMNASTAPGKLAYEEQFRIMETANAASEG